jgi:hypothetical protein
MLVTENDGQVREQVTREKRDDVHTGSEGVS